MTAMAESGPVQSESVRNRMRMDRSLKKTDVARHLWPNAVGHPGSRADSGI